MADSRYQFVSILSVLILTLAITACATTEQLDTPNKRAYAAELAIEGALHQLDQYERQGPHEHGQFTASQWKEIKNHLRDLRDARVAMIAALGSGDDIGADVATVYRVLSALRPYIVREDNGDE